MLTITKIQHNRLTPVDQLTPGHENTKLALEWFGIRISSSTCSRLRLAHPRRDLTCRVVVVLNNSTQLVRRTCCFALPAHLDRTKYRYCCCVPLARSTQTQLVRRVLTTRLMPLAARSAPHWASPDAPVVGPLLGGRGDSQTHALNAGSMLPARPQTRIQPEEGSKPP